MKIAEIMVEEKIKHAEGQSLVPESGHPQSTVSSVTLQMFTPEPQHFLQTSSSSFPSASFAH